MLAGLNEAILKVPAVKGDILEDGDCNGEQGLEDLDAIPLG